VDGDVSTARVTAARDLAAISGDLARVLRLSG
jgi:hypothetical protein